MPRQGGLSGTFRLYDDQCARTPLSDEHVRVLQDHGHTVTFFAFADSEQFLLDARLPCQVICSDLFPEGYVKRKLQALGKLDR